MGLTQTVREGFVKVYNFVQREIAYTVQIDTQAKYITFGPLDHFPNKLAELVEGSPTATSCLSTLTDFITGEGFNEGEELENLVVNNQGLKFFTFHNIQSDNFSHNWGVATLVKFNKLGQITEFFDLPFGNCRLGVPDDKGIIAKIHYNPYFGNALLFKKQDTVIYDVYNPQNAVVQINKDPKFKGQIFWMGVKTTRHPFYPIPDYYSAQHWMRIEKNAAVYFDENLENGFLVPTILKLIGDPNDPSGLKDSEGNDIPKGAALDKELTTKFAGAKKVGQLLVTWANTPGEWPITEAFPSNGNADMHRVTDEHATKKITIATKVVGILANISEGVSLGGDGNTIRAAVKLQQQRAIRPQSILVDYYSELLANLVKPYTEAITIVQYNPFPELESVDPAIWTELTVPERRQWIKDHTEIDLIEPEDPALAEPEPEPPAQARISNLHFNTYPKEARENVRRALEFKEKMNVNCLKPYGLKFSADIMNGTPLGPKEIRRLSSFLSKRTTAKDKTWDNCETLEYYAWGGSEMMLWANEKAKELKGETD